MSALRRAPARNAHMRVRRLRGAIRFETGDVTMSITKKSSTLLVAVIAATSFVSGAAYAQQVGDNDTLAHITQPRADGKCWIATQQPVMDNGYGYWGACKTAATTGSGSTSAARRARAQVHNQN